ncbi:hypothetical protein HNY73_010809 [Argiope bruennichi]|uniref:Uncharacterized protein n=1 Tax=Argiope bruennichi TaxID=94029 RepID=A0A8T0F282_ARGBR|nr:hypothetical protein HNY73_010809 [Argiope bruennichi]
MQSLVTHRPRAADNSDELAQFPFFIPLWYCTVETYSQYVKCRTLLTAFVASPPSSVAPSGHPRQPVHQATPPLLASLYATQQHLFNTLDMTPK